MSQADQVSLLLFILYFILSYFIYYEIILFIYELFYAQFSEADFFYPLNHLLLHTSRRAALLLWPSAMQIRFAAFP